MAMLDQFDRLIPPADRGDAVNLRKGRLLVGLLLVIVLPLPLFAANFAAEGQWVMLGIHSGLLALLVGVLALYRVTGARVVATQVLLSLGLLSMALEVLFTGGLVSFNAPFLASVPIIAFTMIGRRGGLVWSAAVLLCIGALLAIDLAGLTPPSVLQDDTPVHAAANLMTLVVFCGGGMLFHETLSAIQLAEVRRQRARAEAANRVKNAFLANISHELRTPLNGVLGLTDALLEEEAGRPDALRDTLHDIRGCGQGLARLLDELIDVSQVDAGSITVSSLPMSIDGLVAEIIEELQPAAAEKGLVLSHAPGEAGWARGAAPWLRKVLRHLVDNAIKFTDAGMVSVGAARTEERVVLVVRDTGVGLSDEQQAHLFEPFMQADGSSTRRFGGAGLGLSLARRLVEQMDGTVSVESRPGEGSTFTVSLPLPPCEVPLPAPGHQAVPTGLRVLVAEDNLINQQVVVRMLGSIGAQVSLAADGAAAVKLAGQQPPDVVLMDLHMPNMDGLEATRCLRAAGLRAPIVALTASALPEDEAAAMEAGMDAFLSKPVSRSLLLHTLARFSYTAAVLKK